VRFAIRFARRITKNRVPARQTPLARLVLSVYRDRLKAENTVVLGIHGGESIHKEARVRSSLLALTLLLGGCGFLDQLQLGGPSYDPNKIYLSPTDKVSVGTRETHRYVCANGPLMCVSRGVGFDCYCP